MSVLEYSRIDSYSQPSLQTQFKAATVYSIHKQSLSWCLTGMTPNLLPRRIEGSGKWIFSDSHRSGRFIQKSVSVIDWALVTNFITNKFQTAFWYTMSLTADCPRIQLNWYPLWISSVDIILRRATLCSIIKQDLFVQRKRVVSSERASSVAGPKT